MTREKRRPAGTAARAPRDRVYYVKNRDRILARVKTWYNANADRVAAYKAEWRGARRVSLRAYNRAWYRKRHPLARCETVGCKRLKAVGHSKFCKPCARAFDTLKVA